jgi:CubicO group peptidase (beta-lactamase class C family)
MNLRKLNLIPFLIIFLAGGVLAESKARKEATSEEMAMSFRDLPNLDVPYISYSPDQESDALKVGSAELSKKNKAELEALIKEIQEGQHGKFDSLLIVHNGKLIFESYYNRGRSNLAHGQASATKGYLSLAVGRAIELGYLSMADLDKPVVNFLKKLDKNQFVDGAELISLQKALVMSSGIQLSIDEINELEDKYADQFAGQGQVQVYLQHSPAISSELQKYDYKRSDPQIVMQVLDAVVPGGAEAFIKTELMGKLGISDFSWSKSISGQLQGPYGASLKSRDMIKFGMLLRQGGKWNGEQIIAKEYLKATKVRALYLPIDVPYFSGENISKPAYSNYFWLANLKGKNGEYPIFSIQGGGGQYVVNIEDLDLMIVSTGRGREIEPLKLISERMIPLFEQ